MDNGCGPDNLFIRNKTACLDGYRDGWKHWCHESNETSNECNDLAKQGIIQDNVRNQTLVDLQTNINETSDNSPKAPPGAVENIFMGNGTSIIKNSTGTYPGPAAIIKNETDYGPVRALTDKGISLGNLGNHAGAIEYYDKALAMNPKYVRSLYNKGYDLAASGNHTGAIEFYDKALAIDPKHVGALDGKGQGLTALGNYTGAILYYDKVLAIDPNDENTLFNKGLALHKLGNYTGAIEYFDKALAIDPHDVDALNNKGADLEELGNHTGAIEFYNKTLAIDPKNTFALTNCCIYTDR